MTGAALSAPAPRFVDAAAIDAALDWTYLIDELEAGHRVGRARIGDLLIADEATGAGPRKFYSRAAWLADGDFGLKTFTVFPDNPKASPPRPSVQGVMVLFDAATGAAAAILDGAAVTAWKTAADSALAARILARADAQTLLMIGAGAMARPLIEAHRAARPSIEKIRIWNRSPSRAAALAKALDLEGCDVAVAEDLEPAIRAADIVSCATLSRQALVRGAWLQPGTHLDLVGAFTPAMRECDDEAVRRSRIFVDCRETAIHKPGDLARPLAAGVISESDILGDLVDLLAGDATGRRRDDEITFYKNGGGAHLDLMTARAVVKRLAAA